MVLWYNMVWYNMVVKYGNGTIWCKARWHWVETRIKHPGEVPELSTLESTSKTQQVPFKHTPLAWAPSIASSMPFFQPIDHIFQATAPQFDAKLGKLRDFSLQWYATIDAKQGNCGGLKHLQVVWMLVLASWFSCR